MVCETFIPLVTPQFNFGTSWVTQPPLQCISKGNIVLMLLYISPHVISSSCNKKKCIWVSTSNNVISKLITSDLPLFRCSRTISMETGCQNIQLCVAILKVVFPPQVIGPMFLFPLIYITFQCAEALFLVLCFRCYQTFKPPAEGKCHSCLCVLVERGWKEAWRGQTSTCTLAIHS